MTQQDQPADRRGSGIGREIRNVRVNGAASLQELREFVSTLKGRRPQEVMGVVAGSGLIQGILISIVGSLMVLFLATAIPYFMLDEEPVAKKPPAPAKASNDSRQKSGKTRQPESSASDTTQTGDPVLDSLGIGETRNASPDENPLEKKLDNLLDGVK